MFLSIDSEKYILDKDFIGIFDTDKITLSKRGQIFLNLAQKNKKLVVCGSDLPKSCVVTKESVYLCQNNTSTFKKRLYDLFRD